MGSVRQMQLEFPMAFLDALVAAPLNTNILLVDACCEDQEKCNFIAWKTEDAATLVLDGKEGGLKLRLANEVLSFRVSVGSAEDEAEEPPALEEPDHGDHVKPEEEEDPSYVVETEEEGSEEYVYENGEEEGEVRLIKEEIVQQQQEIHVQGSFVSDVEMQEVHSAINVVEDVAPPCKYLYMCPDDGCTLEFADMGNLMKHIRSDCHRNQPNFAHLSEMVKSMDKTPISDVLRLICPLCQAQIGPKTGLRHIGDEHSEHPQYEFAISYVRSTIREHRKRRDRLRTPGGKPCPYCGKEYVGLRNWRRHVKNWCRKNPNREVIHLCTRCSFQSRDKVKFDAHTEMHRGEDENVRFICEHCDKPYKSASGLRVHQHIIHPEVFKVLPFKCHLCSKSFESKEELKKHATIHTDERFNCELCTATYKHALSLRQHVKNFHNGQFPVHCKKCGSGVASQQVLPLHKCATQARSQTEDDANKVECHICHALFLNSKVLSNHIRLLHHNRYPYKCDKCGHGVRSKVALARHKCDSSRLLKGSKSLIVENSEVRSPGRPRITAADIYD